MAKEWAKAFYNSQKWKDTRDGYYRSINGLCERCLKDNKITPGEIVHHKTYITPNNINDINITLNWDNLMLVCRECHKKIHDGDMATTKEGLIFNKEGDIVYEYKDIS